MQYSNLDFTIKKNKSYAVKTKLCVKNFVLGLPILSIKSFQKIELPSELNFFRKIHISEPQHSCILGDLLNPRGSHRQGSIFLWLFFETLGIQYSKKDFWTVSVEKERFDIRIATKSYNKIIIIENKSNWAEDQPNQLYRYWYFGIYLTQKKFKKEDCWSKILYFSPSDFKTPREQTFSRPKDFDKKLPEKVPTEISVIFFDIEIEKWLSKCMEFVKENAETGRCSYSQVKWRY